MPVKVRIPSPLQGITGGKPEVEAGGRDVLDLLDQIERAHPGFKEKVCDEQGKIRRYLNIYVNEQDIRALAGDRTPLKDGDHVAIIPAIAGGGF